MSAYQVNKICHLILHDRAFRAAILAEMQSAIADFDLTDEERAALLRGDVAELVELGAASFLLMVFPRFGVCGLNFETYNQRIRTNAERQHRKYGSTPYTSR